MKKIIIIVGVGLIFLGTGYSLLEKERKAKRRGAGLSNDLREAELKIITAYDNNLNLHNLGLKTGWGFSCVLEYKGEKILFDAGNDSEKLLFNMERLDIKPEEIEGVVLSHIHNDHTGGIWGFLEKNSKVRIYIPFSFPDSFRRKIDSYGVNYQDVKKGVKIKEGVFLTGEMGEFVKEQAAVLKTKKGLVVLTGCTHLGVVDLVKKGKEMTGEEAYLVLGGFHLLDDSDLEIKEVIKKLKKLGIKKVAPCHCSGDRARSLFKEAFKEDYIENGAGKIIRI